MNSATKIVIKNHHCYWRYVFLCLFVFIFIKEKRVSNWVTYTFGVLSAAICLAVVMSCSNSAQNSVI